MSGEPVVSLGFIVLHNVIARREMTVIWRTSSGRSRASVPGSDIGVSTSCCAARARPSTTSASTACTGVKAEPSAKRPAERGWHTPDCRSRRRHERMSAGAWTSSVISWPTGNGSESSMLWTTARGNACSAMRRHQSPGAPWRVCWQTRFGNAENPKCS